MASPRKLDFSSPSTKKKLVLPVGKRIWSEDEELTLLKGLVDYKANKMGLKPNSDWDAFIRFLGGSVAAKFSKEQIVGKVNKLKGKFRVWMRKTSKGSDPLFTNPNDSQAFAFSKLIWSQNDSQFAIHTKSHEETLKDDEELDSVGFANAQHSEDGEETLKEYDHLASAGMNNAQLSDNGEDTLKDNEELDSVGIANAQHREDGEEKEDNDQETNAGMDNTQHSEDGDEQVPNGEPFPENKTQQEVKDDDDTDAEDETCAVKDAFEALLSRDLSEYRKKLQMKKVAKLRAGKRKELSSNWKKLCDEEAKMDIKRCRFRTELAEAIGGDE